MSITITTAPTFEPLTLVETKRAIDVGHGEDDLRITRLMCLARRVIERRLDRTLPTTTLTLSLDAWPIDGIINVPRSPVSSVTSIKYIDTLGVQQTWAASKYQLDIKSIPARICPAYSESYPSLRTQFNAIEIEYVAGYAQSDIPDTLKHVVAAIVRHFYDHPGIVVPYTIVTLPAGIEALIAIERDGMIYGNTYR